MKIELKQFRQLHLTCEELCVAAAFLQVPCLYGVSGRWMKRRQDNLHKRVIGITKSMERKKLLLPEISGEIHLDETLFKLVTGMNGAEHVGRISYASGNDQGKVFLYRKEKTIVFLEPDGRGNFHAGILDAKSLEKVFSNKVSRVQGERAFEKRIAEWMGVLLFEKRNTFYEPLMDFAWKPENEETPEEAEIQLADCWKSVCRYLGQESANGGKME